MSNRDRPEALHLDGWRQIARHLGVSEKTARSYLKKEPRLPVQKIGGRYSASSDGLDRWKREHVFTPRLAEGESTAPDEIAVGRDVIRPNLSRRRLLAVAALCLVAAGAAGLGLASHFSRTRSSGPTLLRVSGTAIEVLDSRGEPLWTDQFDSEILGEGAAQPLFKDVDGDGLAELFFSLHPRAEQVRNGRIIGYSSEGKRRWEKSLGRPVVGDRAFEQTYVAMHLGWIDASPTEHYLLVLSRHAIWYPCQVLLLNPSTGETISEYWHPGHLGSWTTLDLDHDGHPELILGGINNPGPGTGHPVLVALRIPFGPPSLRPGQFFQFPYSPEVAYRVFPKVDFADRQGWLASVLQLSARPDGGLLAIVSGEQGYSLTFYLDETLRVVDVRPPDRYVILHRRAQAEGFLSHEFTEEERRRLRRASSFDLAPDGNAIP